LNETIADSAVNDIILSPTFPEKPDILLLLDDTLQLSRDQGQSWLEPKTEMDLTQGIMSVLTPQGFDSGLSLLAGLATGEVIESKILA
jgi:hypothetical protein